MTIRHFVTHHISKESNDPAATLQCSEHEADLDNEQSERFYSQATSQLKGILTQRGSKRYGAFHPEVTLVRAQIQDWKGERQSFLALTRRISQHFANSLDNTQFAIDGYLAFIYEELADSDRLYLFHLRRKTSVSINADMTLTETHYIDFSNTGFGMMLNLTDWLVQEEAKYITFSYGRSDKPTQNQFAEFVGFTDTLDTAAETEEFLQIIDEFSQNLPAEQSYEYKSKVVDYCMEQDKRGEPVDFTDLADYVESQMESKPESRSGEDFSHYIVEKQKERQASKPALTPEQMAEQGASTTDVAEAIKTELIPDRKKLKSFIRYSGKNKDISLSFSAAMLEQDIVFDGVNNRLQINKLPESLVKQLKSRDSSD